MAKNVNWRNEKMRKCIAILLCLFLAAGCLSAFAEPLESGERKIGVDFPAGWYAILLEKSGFGATHVYLPEGCILDLPEKALLFPIADIPDPGVAFDDGGLRLSNQGEAASGERLLYDDGSLSVSYSDLRVEKIGEKSYMKTELLFVNKTSESIHFVCDSIIVNGCAVDISKFVDVPGDCKYLHEWTNSAEMYLKYGISKIETFSMVFDYRGESFKGVSMERSKTIYLK
jgi:hypothetical protein